MAGIQITIMATNLQFPFKLKNFQPVKFIGFFVPSESATILKDKYLLHHSSHECGSDIAFPCQEQNYAGSAWRCPVNET